MLSDGGASAMENSKKGSDYMTETLEQIKKTIAEAHEQGIYNWNTATISALITTIESLQENLKRQVEGHKYTAGRYSDEMKETKRLNSLLESQKEEIEKLREIQRVLVLTPMQRMSKAIDTIEEFKARVD